jgi:hypothetical protein
MKITIANIYQERVVSRRGGFTLYVIVFMPVSCTYKKKYKKDKIYMRIDSPRMKLLICEPPRAITGLLPRVMREGRKCKTPNAMLYNQEYTEMQAQGNLRDDASSWPC